MAVSSCKKFLQSYSQNLSYVNSATDLNELLIGNGYMGDYSNEYPYNQVTMVYGSGTSDYFYPWVDVSTDDAVEFVEGTPNATTDATPVNKLSGFHFWQPLPFTDVTNTPMTDNDWSRFYSYVAGVNAIIFQAEKMRPSGVDIAMLNKVEGEAYFLRAAYYYLLVNIYGAPYAKASASTDPGVPLKINADVDDKTFTRASVADVYSQIVSDLKTSIGFLDGVVQPSIFRANQTAAQLLLSRVYLYMEDYTDAVSEADSVLAGPYTLNDLNYYTTGSDFNYNGSPEVVFSMGGYTTNDIFVNDAPYSWSTPQADSYQASPDLMSTFDSTDLRLKAFFTASGGAQAPLPAKLKSVSTTTLIVSSGFLLRLSEAYLNKAEALAQLGNSADAQSTIQLLRAARFTPAGLSAVTATGSALVSFIRDERRRELCFESQRWFDLRRYAVNSLVPFTKSISHPYYTYANSAWNLAGHYVLNTYDQDKAAYIIPIPDYEISFDNGSLTNETRPARSVQP
jgi:hypothetical protein